MATCSRVESPVARGTQRFSRLSSLLSRKWNFQSRKKLRKFFQKFSFKCSSSWPWRLARDLIQSRKTHVLHWKVLFLYWFQKGFSFLSLASFFNTIVLTHIIFNNFVTTFSFFKERFGFLSLTLYLSHLLDIPLGFCFSTDICISLDCTWVSDILVKSLCVFLVVIY